MYRWRIIRVHVVSRVSSYLSSRFLIRFNLFDGVTYVSIFWRLIRDWKFPKSKRTERFGLNLFATLFNLYRRVVQRYRHILHERLFIVIIIYSSYIPVTLYVQFKLIRWLGGWKLFKSRNNDTLLYFIHIYERMLCTLLRKPASLTETKCSFNLSILSTSPASIIPSTSILFINTSSRLDGK